MANRVDLSWLREQTMGSTADEEAVTVNTRALIDKVLARYSGDWTTLRELIQNAADASARKVIIRFETLPFRTVPVPTAVNDSTLLKHTLLNHTIHRLVVSNDGEHFADSDWNRLKRIAEGNPDETKIGAFGVGFYSVFADCEEPFVISGSQTMAFMWKGNSLYTKSSSVPLEASNQPRGQDTCFLLNYRNTTSPVPDLISICQFLSTSLTFVGLETIELYLDNWNVFTLTKTSAPGAGAQLPKDIKTKTKEGMMKIIGVVHQSTQINAKWINAVGWSAPKGSQVMSVQDDMESTGPSLRSFFSKLKVGSSGLNASASRRAAKEAEQQQQQLISEDLVGISRATVFLRISTVNIQTYVSETFAQELERATKKPPPKHTRIAILTSSHDDTTASLSTVSGVTAKKAAELFASVLPTKNGRIFIGFPTGQTTGLLCHISAPSVIPTVERESIDLNARYVKTWNIEMLRVAGIACRIAYMDEMEALQTRIQAAIKSKNNPVITPADINDVLPHAVHVSKQYTAVESTPSSTVGKIIDEAFWESSTRSSIDVLSTQGVLPSNQVRVVSETLSFLEKVPIIPADLASGAVDFVRKLYEKGLLSDLTIKDIKKELESRSLNNSQLIEFLKWAAAQLSSGQLDAATVQAFMASAVATVSEEFDVKARDTEGKVLVLAQIKTFLSGSKISPELPLPPHTMPFKFTKSIPRQQLEAFGWEELQIVPWFRFLVDCADSSAADPAQCLTKSPQFASQALLVLSKSWDSLSQGSKATLVDDLLSKRTIIPTKLGMRRPADSYFPSVKLFDDLPTIVGLHSGIKDKVLAALGVRKTVELNVVFERLMAKSSDGEQKWSFPDLVRYLVSVRDDIPNEDIERLKSTAICSVEEDPASSAQPGRLYKVSELFEPKDVLRALGLPILRWSGDFRLASPEGRLLAFLGLKSSPEVTQLVSIMQKAASGKDQKLYIKALRFFIDHHHANGYAKFDVKKIAHIPFLPTEGQAFPILSPPNACFWNHRASAMGYGILRTDLHPHATQFGVAQDPPIQDCATRLTNTPPASRREAVEKFGYLAGRLGEIKGALAEVLGNSNIVPITTTKTEKRAVTRFNAPKMCFLGDPSVYGDMLDFVDFGLEANSFLLKIGSKHEPSSVELARMVVENPARILGMLEPTRYIDLLRKLAENRASLKADNQLWKGLKTSPCLLAYKEHASSNLKAGEIARSKDLDEYPLDDDESTVRVHSLRKASDIIIADSIRELMIFREYISCAPQDEVIEGFYGALGVPLLTSLVDTDHRVGNARRDQSEAVKTRKLIIERSRLFLYEHLEDVRHDSKWLEKNLTVAEVDSIALSSTLIGYPVPPHREKRSATLKKEGGGKYTLYITRHPELYEISTWIVRLLLNRPKQHDTLALEMVMGSDLRKLRARGYNVDRILKQKAYESRVADDERKKQMVEDEKRARAQVRTPEKEKPNEKDALGPPPPYEAVTPERGSDGMSKHYADSQLTMPGAFESDSPESAGSRSTKKPNSSLFGVFQDSMQQWSKQLGIGEQQDSKNAIPESSRQKQIAHTPAHDVDPVESERNIAKNLTSAIQASRSATSNNVFTEPRTTTVEEAKGSYCDTTPAQDISFVATSSGGIKIYIANSVKDQRAFVSSESHDLDIFSFILLDLGSIFSLSPQSIHIFFDDRGATIAFNQNGALFFNYSYFRKLHQPRWETSRSMKIDTIAYWWITLCHELAHNLVQEHSARHSFYAESFAQMYFGKVMDKALQYN